nr:hypothetical protein [Sulfitobacter faviae]
MRTPISSSRLVIVWSEDGRRTIICASGLALPAARRWSVIWLRSLGACSISNNSQSIPLPAAISVTVGEQSESQKPDRRLLGRSVCFSGFPDIFAAPPSNGIDNWGDTVIYQFEQDVFSNLFVMMF